VVLAVACEMDRVVTFIGSVLCNVVTWTVVIELSVI
jgi:hypothetical protein